MSTKRPDAPTVAVTDSLDFWRGAIDGDGHIDNAQEYPAASLAGRLPLIVTFCAFLVRHGLAALNPFEGVHGVWVAGTTGSTAKAIIEYLYNGATVYLDRKFACAQEIAGVKAATPIGITPHEGAEEALTRLHGTPLPYQPMLDKDALLIEIVRLKDAHLDVDEENVIRPLSQAGGRICGPFFPNRYEAKRKGGSLSALEAWGDKKALRKAIDFQLAHGDPVEPHRVLRAITLHCRTPTVFRPSIAKYVYERYCRRGGVAWDPCSGYGGRLLGAYAAGVRYIGTDVDENTAEGNRRLAQAVGANAEILTAAAETFDPGKVDLVFTSPPYFDREMYAGGKSQSWRRYDTLDSWVEGFLRPVIATAHRVLDEHGHLALNIADLKERNKVVPLVARTIETALACGFAHVDTLQMPLAAINRKSPTEPILVFKKKSAAP